MESVVVPGWLWVVFGVVVIITLFIDLGVTGRREHAVSMREALVWFGVWVALALVFDVGVYFVLGQQPALLFVTGFIIEKALSVDNIFVFIVIFTYFGVPGKYQHRVLFWGVLGAFVLRGVFIGLGVSLINKFHWTILVLGAFLIYTGIKILVSKEDEEVDPSKSRILRLFRRFVPLHTAYDGHKFLTRQNGRLLATPLLMVLVMIEATDVVFAVDSIPAVLGVTTDPFVVYTSNVFAILGLRNLYFVLADFMNRFEYLKVGLGIVLAFVGAKMVLAYVGPWIDPQGSWFEIPVGISLAVVATLLAGSVLVSVVLSRRREEEEGEKPSLATAPGTDDAQPSPSSHH